MKYLIFNFTYTYNISYVKRLPRSIDSLVQYVNRTCHTLANVTPPPQELWHKLPFLANCLIMINF